MPPPSLGFLILFLWIQGSVNGTEVMGIIGNAVDLRCHYSVEEPLVQDMFRVFWQIKEENSCVVDAYNPNQPKNQCMRFINRTRLSNKLKQGDFTLQLFNISHNDEHMYTCHVLQKKDGKFQLVHKLSITLKVAANYSKPVLTSCMESEEKVTFTCNSSHGYPKPKVYWINQMDNSLFNGTLLELTVEPSGTFSVVTTLTIQGASCSVEVRCVIENERLHENLTIDSDSANHLPSSPSSQPETQAPVPPAVAGIVVVFLFAILLGLWCWCKRRPSLQQYTDLRLPFSPKRAPAEMRLPEALDC